MPEVKSLGFINIQGWAVNKLHLKGSELIVYSVIYGFSQDGHGKFNGSLNYLQEWTQSTRQGVIKSLKGLIDKNLIIKVESTPTNIYYANLKALDKIIKEDDVNSVTEDVNLVTNDVNSVTDGVNLVNNDSKLSLQNNINNNIINNIDNNKYKASVELDNIVKDIIVYLNNKCNTHFRSTTAENKKLIKARLKEGFTVSDFKKVIDCKYLDWGEKPVRFKNGYMSNEYLRPSTLFAGKFESYLNEANLRETSEYDSPYASVSSPIDTDVSDMEF